MLPTIESLTVEFKSDRKRLSDVEVVEAVVCLANADGGDVWLGVEDDGTPTGLHREHQMLTGLAGMVAARTSPSVRVTVSSVEAGGVTVARISVPKAQGEVATDGAYTRQAGFAPIQNEQMVLSYVRQCGRIKRAKAMELCCLSEGQVKGLLKRLGQSDLLVLEGAGPASCYRIGASDRMKSNRISDSGSVVC